MSQGSALQTNEVDLTEAAHELRPWVSTEAESVHGHGERSARLIRPQGERLAGSPARHVRHEDTTSPDPHRRRSNSLPKAEGSISEAFVASLRFYTPIPRPEGYPELTYKPLLLRRRLLFPLLIFYISCAAFVASLLFLDVSAPTDLHVKNMVGYELFNYIPIILGSITTITFRALVSSYGRILPYLTMGSATLHTRQRNDVHNTQTILAGTFVSFQMFSLSGGLEFLRYGHTLTFLLYWSRIIINTIFTPMKTTLIRVNPDSRGWQVLISNGVAYGLLVFYMIIIGNTVSIIARMWNATTGLKWDAGSYAARIALFQDSNVPDVLRALNLDYSTSNADFIRKLKKLPAALGPLRLGYWQADGEDTRPFHSINFMGSPEMPRQTTINAPDSTPHGQGALSPDQEPPSDGDHEDMSLLPDSNPGYNTQRPEQQRYFNSTFFLSDSMLLFGLISCCAILGVFVTWITSGKVGSGWSFHHSDEANAPLNIIYIGEVYLALVPAVINSFFNLIWFNADLFYRTTEPLAGMFTPRDARENILLDYVSPDSFSISATSLGKKHWRVAYFTLLTLLAPFVSTFAANIFFLSRGDETDHLGLIPTNFYVSVAAVSLYAVSLVIARPPIRYRFPRMILNLADMLSYCYASSLMTAPEFSVQEPSDEEVHLQAKVHLAKRKYCFGFYKGKDGRRHLGFDADHTANPDGTTTSVETVIPGKFALFPLRRPWWVGSRRRESWGPRLARHGPEQMDSESEDEEQEGLARVNSTIAPSFMTASEFPQETTNDESQVRPIRHVDTLLLEAGLGHGRSSSRPVAGSSGVTRIQQNHHLQQRAMADEQVRDGTS